LAKAAAENLIESDASEYLIEQLIEVAGFATWGDKDHIE
jgi:hypothetical protein